MMKVLLCGSMAYDTIMVFPGQFGDHIQADHLHILSVAFIVPESRREFGGTASNMAYHLKRLGGEPIIYATVGEDFASYNQHLQEQGIALHGLRTISDQYTAQAFITTDRDNNQITAFHPGAMEFSDQNVIPGDTKARWAIVSPDGREGMLQHAQQLKQHGIPFIFDPGQAIPAFNGEELRSLIQHSSAVAVNDYEIQLLQDKTSWDVATIAQKVQALIVTKGAGGSSLYYENKEMTIPSIPAQTIIDPTGCGDAYRAGLLYGLAHGWQWERSALLGSLMGSLKISQPGGQNLPQTRQEISRLFAQMGQGSLDD